MILPVAMKFQSTLPVWGATLAEGTTELCM